MINMSVGDRDVLELYRTVAFMEHRDVWEYRGNISTPVEAMETKSDLCL